MNWPVENPTITQLFGANPEDYKRWGYPGHNGLDLWTGADPQFVYSIEPGVVEKVGWEEKGYGKYVVILHDHNWRSYYAHLNQVHVLPGSKLPASAALGLMGSTGNSSGPHLHLGIRMCQEANPAYKGYVDPLPILRGQPLTLCTGQQGDNPLLPTGYEEVTLYPSPADPPKKYKGLQPAVFVSRRGNKTVYRMRRYF